MDDSELITRLATDLDGTFEDVVRAHQDRLFSVALRLLGDPSDAEEVAQDAFVRAYRALNGYDAERIRVLQLRGWLATIVINLSRNRVRGRRPPAVPLDADTGRPGSSKVPDSIRDTFPDPEAATTRLEERETWARLLTGLPDRYRIPLVLRHIDELSYPEMAAALGRPEGTVKAQVHRGLALLRDAYIAEDGARGDTAGRPSRRAGALRDGEALEAASPADTAVVSQSRSPDPTSSPEQAPRLEVVR